MDTINITPDNLSNYHDKCHNSNDWPSISPVIHHVNSLWYWIEQNHRQNCLLWNEEDKARRIDVADSEIADNKRNIDRYNQARNNAIEKIDEKMLDMLSSTTISENAWFNSETLGSIIDRLSIISLKIYHMRIHSTRNDIDDTQREISINKYKILLIQRSDLLYCLNNLLENLKHGTAFYKIYRQFKMYNDPTTNPYLSGYYKK